MGAPQTTREALLAELLGDVGDVLDRVDALKLSIPAAADAAVESIRAEAQQIGATLESVAQTMRDDMHRDRGSYRQDVQEARAAAKAATLAAEQVTADARNMRASALLVGACAGAFAGLVTGGLVFALWIFTPGG